MPCKCSRNGYTSNSLLPTHTHTIHTQHHPRCRVSCYHQPPPNHFPHAACVCVCVPPLSGASRVHLSRTHLIAVRGSAPDAIDDVVVASQVVRHHNKTLPRQSFPTPTHHHLTYIPLPPPGHVTVLVPNKKRIGEGDHFSDCVFCGAVSMVRCVS